MSAAIALVQARMGSERLPGKVLMDIAGRPMVEHVLRRAAAAPGVEVAILCFSGSADDRPLVKFALGRYAHYIAKKTATADVLERFAMAVTDGLDLPLNTPLVRLTADCPLIDPMLIARTLREHREYASPFTTTTPNCGYPDGQDIEIFDVATLLNAAAAASDSYDREHVTPWMRRTYGVTEVQAAQFHQAMTLKMSVDTEAELAFARRVHEALGPGLWGLPAILDYLKRTGDKP